ncbi:MAG: LysM peptidoglycan-binding domain-containing protein [Candidatus Dadabacteria bacterium]|nr:MAG: LysM peptidoglycan-binding domain-containing protein [Candidatus Dadabacteria bacterium]
MVKLAEADRRPQDQNQGEADPRFVKVGTGVTVERRVRVIDGRESVSESRGYGGVGFYIDGSHREEGARQYAPQGEDLFNGPVKSIEEQGREIAEFIHEKTNTGLFGTGNDEKAVLDAVRILSQNPELRAAADRAMQAIEHGKTVSEYLKGQLKGADLERALYYLGEYDAGKAAENLSKSFRRYSHDRSRLEFGYHGKSRLEFNVQFLAEHPEYREAVLTRFRKDHKMELSEAIEAVRGISREEKDKLIEQAYGFDAERTARIIYEHAGDEDRVLALLAGRDSHQVIEIARAFERLPENEKHEKFIDYLRRKLDGKEELIADLTVKLSALEVDTGESAEDAMTRQGVAGREEKEKDSDTPGHRAEKKEIPGFDYHTYKLKNGESLSVVERKFGIGRGDGRLLMMINGVQDASRLPAGFEVKIPAAYAVKKGDTLNEIAASLNKELGRSDLTAQKIFEYNRAFDAAGVRTAVGSNIDQIYADRTLYIPPQGEARNLGPMQEKQAPSEEHPSEKQTTDVEMPPVEYAVEPPDSTSVDTGTPESALTLETRQRAAGIVEGFRQAMSNGGLRHLWSKRADTAQAIRELESIGNNPDLQRAVQQRFQQEQGETLDRYILGHFRDKEREKALRAAGYDVGEVLAEERKRAEATQKPQGGPHFYGTNV